MCPCASPPLAFARCANFSLVRSACPTPHPKRCSVGRCTCLAPRRSADRCALLRGFGLGRCGDCALPRLPRRASADRPPLARPPPSAAPRSLCCAAPSGRGARSGLRPSLPFGRVRATPCPRPTAALRGGLSPFLPRSPFAIRCGRNEAAGLRPLPRVLPYPLHLYFC